MNNNNLGFTLIEIVIVLAILGLLIASTLTPLSTKYEQSQRQETLDKLDQIKNAIYGFAIVNGRLPCPDIDIEGSTGFGTENLQAEKCTQANGTLPFTTLGVNANVDAWGKPFKYQVTPEWADDPSVAVAGAADGTGCGIETAGVSFELCSDGDITIDNTDLTDSTIVTDKVPVLVFSGGKNDFSTSNLEEENNDSDNTFVYSDYRMVTDSEYDDLMIWISPSILKYRMVQAGRLP